MMVAHSTLRADNKMAAGSGGIFLQYSLDLLSVDLLPLKLCILPEFDLFQEYGDPTKSYKQLWKELFTREDLKSITNLKLP